MIRHAGDWALVLVCSAAAAGMLFCGASPTPAQQADVAAWAPLDAVCTVNATSRAQDDYCRDQLRHLFCGDGGMLTDSGGCARVMLSDGGSP